MSNAELCHLCGLPLGAMVVNLVVDDNTRLRFCCRGCQQVYSMLMAKAGTTDPALLREDPIYQKCQSIGLIPASAQDLARREADAQRDKKAPATPETPELNNESQTLQLTLRIDGMWCPACAWVVAESLNRVTGVDDVRCDFSTDRFRCRYDPVMITPAAITKTIEKIGYRTSPPGAAVEEKTRKDSLIRLAVCAFLTANIMMLSFALYSGFLMELGRDAVLKLGWPMAVMATGVVLYGGWPIYRKALWGLRSAAFGLETLITMGSLSAFGFSLYNLVGGSIHLYFDTTTMLLSLVLLGKMLEQNAKSKIQNDIDSFFAISPKKANLVSEAYPNGRYINIEQLKPGDHFLVAAGDIVPADGRIVDGAGAVDEGAVTGESRPVQKLTGQGVKSGTRLVSGRLQVVAQAVGSAATLGQMIAIMEDALSKKTPFEGRTEQLLKWFVPLVAGLAVLTGAVCFYLGFGIETALVRTITVLVIACPCALGVAIPLTRVAAVALSGKHGMVVRDFAAFEKATGIDTVVFDKTGTLTSGVWRLLEIRPAPGITAEQALALAAGLEKECDHFIGREILRYAREKNIEPAGVEQCDVQAGGVSGLFDHQKVKIGSRSFVSAKQNGNDLMQVGRTDGCATPKSFVYLALSDRTAAVLVFGDQIKADAPAAVAALKKENMHLALISGDGAAVSEQIASELGIADANGEMLPAQKADYIQTLQAGGRKVAMVGDGINDAPALVAADLALAIHSGADLGREAATVTLMRGAPTQVPQFIRLSRTVSRKVAQNLGFSICYNLIAIPLAMSGLLNPVVAVCAMLLSSLSVIGNTLMLLRNKPNT